MKIMSCINQEENKIQNCGVYCQQEIKPLIEEVWVGVQKWEFRTANIDLSQRHEKQGGKAKIFKYPKIKHYRGD